MLVAGSATPRPESGARAARALRLPRRVDGAPLPPVEIVDMREARRALHPRTHEALDDARKAIVLLNRRGWSNFLTCRSCGRAWECPECDVTLVLHRAEELLACHHCGHREPVPSRCDACGSVSIARHGTGTERLEHELPALGSPSSGSTPTSRDAAARARRVRAPRRAAMLVGTQMVAKGHDFPDVDLGVVLDADATLRFPDFRAEERTFALVTQLAGRAGTRAARGGRVLVQTLAPDAPSIGFAARHDSDGFLAGELERRRGAALPAVLDADPRRLLVSRNRGAPRPPRRAVRERLGDALGPAPLFRLRGRERGQVVVKAQRPRRRGRRGRCRGRRPSRPIARTAPPRSAWTSTPSSTCSSAWPSRTWPSDVEVAEDPRRRGRAAAARPRGRRASRRGARPRAPSTAIRC